jgi:Protein of unknown function (DUF3995)
VLRTGMIYLLALVLITIAAVHVLWGVGFWFPIRDEATLARTVIGARGITQMPGAMPCSVVAVALLFLAVVLFWPDGDQRQNVVWIAAGTFLVRSAVAYTPFWRDMLPEQPFARLDRLYYAPLCLVIGLGLLLV